MQWQIRFEGTGSGGKRRRRTEEGKADDEVGDYEWEGAVEAVCPLFDEGCTVFEEGGHVRYGHEAHERGSEELDIRA